LRQQALRSRFVSGKKFFRICLKANSRPPQAQSIAQEEKLSLKSFRDFAFLKTIAVRKDLRAAIRDSFYSLYSIDGTTARATAQNELTLI